MAAHQIPLVTFFCVSGYGGSARGIGTDLERFRIKIPDYFCLGTYRTCLERPPNRKATVRREPCTGRGDPDAAPCGEHTARHTAPRGPPGQCLGMPEAVLSMVSPPSPPPSHHPGAWPGRCMVSCAVPVPGQRRWRHSAPRSRSWRKNSSSSCIICSGLKSSSRRGRGTSPVAS